MNVGYSRFETAVQKASGWLAELETDLKIATREHAYALLRAVLHSLRDRLPPVEAVQLGGQLPMLIRGIYYDGWSLRKPAERLKSMDDFVEEVLKIMAPAQPRHPKVEVEGVLALLSRHVDPGEIKDIRGCLPESIRERWPQPALTR